MPCQFCSVTLVLSLLACNVCLFILALLLFPCHFTFTFWHVALAFSLLTCHSWLFFIFNYSFTNSILAHRKINSMSIYETIMNLYGTLILFIYVFIYINTYLLHTYLSRLPCHLLFGLPFFTYPLALQLFTWSFLVAILASSLLSFNSWPLFKF